MTTFQRYMLFHIPGWLIDISVLAVMIQWWALPVWAAIGIFTLLLIKDFALYPFLRVGYETRERSGVERLIGERGVVKQPLDPEGYVLVHGELWKARAASPGYSLDPGTRVRVTASEGMLLQVEVVEQPLGLGSGLPK